MYRVLIVDDEPIAVQSIEFVLNKNFNNINIVGTARSGKDAIEKIYETHPEIIFMDINMPGINGIESMKQIRIKLPEVKFIVISAFDYFDYAVESVALGVEEYLLKPVKESKLVEIVAKIINDIEEEKENIRLALEQKERFEMVSPILENGFINSLCMFDGNEDELQSYCNLFEYNVTSGYVMAIEFGQKSEGEFKNKIGAGVQGQKMYKEYRSILKATCQCIVGPVMLNRIIVYVIEEQKLDTYIEKSEAIRIAQKIFKRISRLYPDVYIGIGQFNTKLSGAKKSYHEALQCLQLLSLEEENSQILHVDDVLEKLQNIELDYENMLEKEVYTSVTSGDVAKSIHGFESIFSRMLQDTRLDFKAIKNRSISLIIGFAKRWESVIGNYGDILIEILEAQNSNELYRICNQFIVESVGQITSVRQKKILGTIEKADNYMESHYDEDISLEDIAKEVNLSSYYFSRFYKGETGINFSDKLTNIRIDKAKEYLLESGLSIKEISFKVGYTDSNYFSKLFKKITGYTASEFKKMSGS